LCPATIGVFDEGGAGMLKLFNGCPLCFATISAVIPGGKAIFGFELKNISN
jgi:hypothetical protein